MQRLTPSSAIPARRRGVATEKRKAEQVARRKPCGSCRAFRYTVRCRKCGQFGTQGLPDQ